MTRTWMRFAVGDRSGHWAPTWKLWLDGQDPRCLHIGCRSVAGHYTFTRRDNGEWRRGFTAAAECTPSTVPFAGVRVGLPPRVAASIGPGLVELMRVHTDPIAVREPNVGGRYRYVAKVPIHIGLANEIGVLAVSRGRAAVS